MEPRPCLALGMLPSAYLSPPRGSSVTSQRWSYSQAGPFDSWGQGRLHEHQPKLKCLVLLLCWLCSHPVLHSAPSAHLWRVFCSQRARDTTRS